MQNCKLNFGLIMSLKKLKHPHRSFETQETFDSLGHNNIYIKEPLVMIED